MPNTFHQYENKYWSARHKKKKRAITTTTRKETAKAEWISRPFQPEKRGIPLTRDSRPKGHSSSPSISPAVKMTPALIRDEGRKCSECFHRAVASFLFLSSIYLFFIIIIIMHIWRLCKVWLVLLFSCLLKKMITVLAVMWLSWLDGQWNPSRSYIYDRRYNQGDIA